MTVEYPPINGMSVSTATPQGSGTIMRREWEDSKNKRQRMAKQIWCFLDATGQMYR